MDPSRNHNSHDLSSIKVSPYAALPPADEAEAPTPRMTCDSLVTVRLSLPSSLTLSTNATSDANFSEAAMLPLDSCPTDADANAESHAHTVHPDGSSPTTPCLTPSLSLPIAASDLDETENDPPAVVENMASSDDVEEVDWEQLEKTEDEQVKDDETDHVRFAANPTSILPSSPFPIVWLWSRIIGLALLTQP